MSKVLKNVTISTIFVSDTGVSIPASSNYTIPPQDYLLWAASSDVITFIGNADLVVNDGSFDLNISDGVDLIKGLFPTTINTVADGTLYNYYNEVSSVASSISTEVISYTAVAGDKLISVDFGGTNIAKYDIKINGSTVAKYWSYFGNLMGRQEFNNGTNDGINLTAGQQVKVFVEHNRPSLGEFNSKIIIQGT